MRHDRHEFIIDAVRLLGVGTGALRGFVQPRAIQRLRAVLCHRREERLKLLVEVHRHHEMERDHAERRAFDDQRQRRRRLIPSIGGYRRRAPIPLLPFFQRSDEHGSPGLHDLRRRRSFLDRDARRLPARIRRLRIQRFHSRRVVDEKDYLAGHRADDDRSMLNHRVRHRIHRHRLGQRGAHRVQAAGACGESAIPRLAGAQRALDVLAFGELFVGVHAQGLRFRARAFRELDLPRAIERVRGVRRERGDVLALVARECPRRLEIQLHDADDAAADHQRHVDCGFEEIGTVIRARGILGDTRCARLQDDGCAAAHGVGDRIFLRQVHGCQARFGRVGDGACDLGVRAVAAGEQQHARISFQRVQRLLYGRLDRQPRRARLRQRSGQLREPARVRRGALRHVTQPAVAPQPANAERDRHTGERRDDGDRIQSCRKRNHRDRSPKSGRSMLGEGLSEQFVSQSQALGTSGKSATYVFRRTQSVHFDNEESTRFTSRVSRSIATTRCAEKLTGIR